jgi:hypothetical protein
MELKNKNILKQLKDIKKEYRLSNCFIAGGCLTSLYTRKEINDIDIYFKDKSSLYEFIENISWFVKSHTNKSTLLSNNNFDYDINIVHFDEFATVNDIFKNFDFTINMCAYDVDNEIIEAHDDFLLHLAQRLLIFNPKTMYPFSSLMRVSKYENKGYSIYKKDFINIILSCIAKNISTYEELEDQIGGMYGNNIKEIIDTSKDFDVNDIIKQIQEYEADIDTSNENAKDSKGDFHKYIDKLFREIHDVKAILINDKHYEFYDNIVTNDIIKEKDLSEYEIIDENTILSFYKWVKPCDDYYCSYFKSDFKYKELEKVEDNINGIWGTFNIKNINNLTYSNKKDKVLIELKVKIKDIISSGKIKSGLVYRVVPSKEY